LGIVTADANEHQQAEPLVPWWSFGKTVLAAAALRLVDQGRLSLDAPLAGAASYTLRQLLQHTSGLRDYGQFPEYHAAVAANETPWPVDELLRRTNATPLFPVGQRFSYSNIGYLFVRQAIERVAGSDLDTTLRTLVFDPLGIEGVFVANTVEEFNRIAWDTARGYDPRWVYMGCIVGSLSWAATFLHRLVHADLLAPSTKTAMLQLVPYGDEYVEASNLGYGLGIMCEPDGLEGRAVGHAGSGPGSTVVVFSFLNLESPRTLAAEVDTSEPEGFLTLIDDLRSEIGGQRLGKIR
jgi:CubicO group peptidase (beta-lactamase class C family)